MKPLTPLAISKLLTNPTPRLVADTRKGLKLRIYGQGRASWVYSYVSPLDGRQKRPIIGEAAGEDFGLREARREADKITGSLEDSRRAIRTAQREGVTPPLPFCPASAQRAGRGTRGNHTSMTVGEALAAYFRARIDEPKPNDAPDVAEAKRRNAGSRRYLTTLFATDAAGSDLRGLPLGYVARLTRADVRDRRRRLLASKGVPTVNRCTSYFSAFLAWAMEELDGLDGNPLAGLRREAGEQEAPREVVASPEELHAMWKATYREEIAVDFARIWRLAVLTGMRRSEIASLTVADIRGDTIHVSRAKTDAGRRIVPMSGPARLIVDAAIADKGEAGPYIFATSMRGARPFGNFSKQVVKLRELAGLQRDVTLHDLRRGVVTRLAGLGIDRTVVKLLVGHARGDANARVYDQHSYLGEMRAAVDALAEDVSRVVCDRATFHQ